VKMVQNPCITPSPSPSYTQRSTTITVVRITMPKRTMRFF
jgi:hypothetical protein